MVALRVMLTRMFWIVVSKPEVWQGTHQALTHLPDQVWVCWACNLRSGKNRNLLWLQLWIRGRIHLNSRVKVHLETSLYWPPLIIATLRIVKDLKFFKIPFGLKREKFCILDNGNPSPPAGACLDSAGQFCNDICSFLELHVAYI